MTDPFKDRTSTFFDLSTRIVAVGCRAGCPLVAASNPYIIYILYSLETKETKNK